MQKLKEARNLLKKKQYREASKIFEEGLNEVETIKGKIYCDISKEIIKSLIYNQDKYEKAMQLISLCKDKGINITKNFELLCYVRIYRETNCLDMSFQKSKELIEQLIFSKNEPNEIVTMVSEVIITYVCLYKFEEAKELLTYLNMFDKLVEEEIKDVAKEDYEEYKIEVKKDIFIKMGFGDMIQLIDLKTASVDSVFKNALNEMIEMQKEFVLNYKNFAHLKIDFNAINDVIKDELVFQNELQRLVLSYATHCMNVGIKLTDVSQYQVVIVELINYLAKKLKKEILTGTNGDIIFKFLCNDYILNHKNDIDNLKFNIAIKAILEFYNYLLLNDWLNQTLYDEIKSKFDDEESLFDRVESFFVLKRSEWKI